jgi:hypothetical protein
MSEHYTYSKEHTVTSVCPRIIKRTDVSLYSRLMLTLGSIT